MTAVSSVDEVERDLVLFVQRYLDGVDCTCDDEWGAVDTCWYRLGDEAQVRSVYQAVIRHCELMLS